MTRNGIEHDLKKSPYHISSSRFVFYFSSSRYENMFHQKMLYLRHDFDIRLSKLMLHDINSDELFLLWLYPRVEKRGYYIYDQKKDRYLERETEIDFD